MSTRNPAPTFRTLTACTHVSQTTGTTRLVPLVEDATTATATAAYNASDDTQVYPVNTSKGTTLEVYGFWDTAVDTVSANPTIRIYGRLPDSDDAGTVIEVLDGITDYNQAGVWVPLYDIRDTANTTSLTLDCSTNPTQIGAALWLGQPLSVYLSGCVEVIVTVTGAATSTGDLHIVGRLTN